MEYDEGVPYEPPLAGDEASAIVGALERQRYVIGWKCGGLDAEGIRRTAAASSITLGGLLKHLALVEDDYFGVRIGGGEFGSPWEKHWLPDDEEWHWRVSDGDTPESLMALWKGAVGRSRAAMTELLTHGGLDQPVALTADDGRSPNLRRMLLDLVEEYARHAGHADIIRESIDGVVGEDPPDADG